MAGIKIKDDGSIVANGMSYKDKAAYKAREKTKKTGNIFEGGLAKEKRAAKASIAQGKANTDATKKMYAAESMFKSAKNREDARVMPGKRRSFKEAFDAATKEGKSRFMLGGKSYLTTKGKREDRFDPTKIKGAEKKESIFSKFKSSKTGSEFFSKLKKKK
jgi:hypothetical protein